MDHLLYFLKRNTLASVGLLLLALLLAAAAFSPWACAAALRLALE